MSPIDTLANLFSTPGGRVPRTVDERAEALAATPAKSTLQIVSSATLLFFAAEKAVNPNVRTLWDALLYTSSCLSVGHSHIQPMTEAGKLIGAGLMTVGPSLSMKTLDGPRDGRADDALQLEILDTLKEMLARMPPEAAPPAPQSTEP